MRKTTVGGLLCFLVCGVFLVVSSAWGQPQETSVGENLDKYIGKYLATKNRAARAGVSRLYPQSCPPFFLRDEFDRVIDENSTQPVSLVQTCGKCHSVETVTGGYHFQMGRDELYPTQKLGEPVPLHKSPGVYGKWQLLYQRELAPKTFEHPDQVDMTSFDFVATCGICHPGGGPTLFDRGGLRYDTVMLQDPAVGLTNDGDYYQAMWHKSGALEPDCLICHLEHYEYSDRAQQIKKLNFKWAATVAGGFGDVEGAVKNGEVPKVKYDKNVFRPDGKVYLKIQRPDDRACLFCHDISGVQKRGTTWTSNYLSDVHTDIGLSCIDCHPGDIRHNFAKGYSSSQSVRDDIDGSALSCKQCHYETGDFGAPAFDHRGLPPLHLERLSCEACHITKRPFLSARTVDVLTGKAIELANEPDPVPPKNLMFGALWGKVKVISPEAPMEPFSREELESAAEMVVSTDSPIRKAFAVLGDEWKLPENAFKVREFIKGNPAIVETPAERALMLLALQQGLDKDVTAVAVFRNKAYKMTSEGLRETKASWPVKRVGAIAEYPVANAVHERNGQKVIAPEGYQLGVFWAYEDKSGDKTVVRPLLLKDMQVAWEFLRDNAVTLYPGKADGANSGDMSSEEAVRTAIKERLAAYTDAEAKRLGVYDDNFDTWPEVNTEDEIKLVAWALVQTVKRLPSPQLYFINGETARRVTIENWDDPFAVSLTEAVLPAEDKPFVAIKRVMERDDKGAPKHEELRLAKPFEVKIEPVDTSANTALAELAQRLPWTISHGVEPAKSALGANTCADCHSLDSPFFFTAATVVPFGDDGLPKTQPVYARLGYNLSGIQIGAWRESVLKPYAKWVVLVVLVVMLLHYMLFGSRDKRKDFVPDVLRFSLHERVGHLILMVTVTYLAASGFCFLLGKHDPLGETARYVHTVLGYVAVAGYVIIFLSWTRDMILNKRDIHWLKGFGGYLGGAGHLPAGKFNAGQKILYWLTILLGVVLIYTGIIMGLNREAHFAGQEWIYTIHDVAAFLMILVLLGHIYLAVFVVPHSLKSLFGGWVSSLWAQEHHPDWKPAKRIKSDV
ncbi:MAG TPA: formate dehydrogenase subunit gamma [Candidatus Hydrogenedentes bacterium]|nr:formate dehydrogenase subunit gamma [Candidatus Hydrogenedentota bacterium]HOL76591.1 formate dehydrogenase subunit gamma [Candidatus Hydrogenedentota bacterium]HPO84424.1 formate dehydrogenase subunit gamma [Candidatus Hydrogenedentota bacterium]